MTVSAAHLCLTCLARRQFSIEEPDDLRIHHLVHRVAIEAFRVLRGLPGHEFQYPRETRDEREMPGPFDENVFRLRRQRLREALGMIPHEGQVRAVTAVTPDPHSTPCG